MSQTDSISAAPFQPIQAPALPDLTNNLFAAYLRANNFERDNTAAHIAAFFRGITPDSSTVQLYTDAHALDESLDKIGEPGIHHVNSYFHITAVAQELRRQIIRRQVNHNLSIELGKRQTGEIAFDTPIPYSSYIPGDFVEWFFPHIDRHGEKREPLIKTPQQLIEVAAQITPEYILTQHPTNSNPVALNRNIASFVAASLEVAIPAPDMTPERANAEFTRMARKFAETPRVPDGNFAVSDEISLSNNSSSNFLSGAAQSFQEMLCMASIRFGDDFTPELQLQLAKSFHVKQGDWSASDDDGNDNIKAEHRLAKLATQRLGMTRLYTTEYDKLAAAGFGFARIRVEQMRAIATHMQTISKDINGLKDSGGDIAMSVYQFNDFSQEIDLACRNVTGISFKEYATQLQQEAEAEFKHGRHSTLLLGLVNNLENSGLHGYHNELRKNCDFNREALGEILKFIPEYKHIDITHKDFNENERLKILNHLIMNPQMLQHAAEQVIRAASPLVSTDRDYSNPLIKAYHTIQSLRLTQAHSDCYENFVLAETRQSSDLLVAQALQAAAQTAQLSAKPHWLHIIPLFEDADTLQNYPVVVLKALTMPAYRKLLFALAGQEGAPEGSSSLAPAIEHMVQHVRQQIMFAHSDSWRLAGRIAADGLLAIARLGKWGLSQLEDLLVEWDGKTAPLRTEKFHGLSLSDPSRSGGRDQIGLIDDKIAARRPKKTIQGVDQANHLNSPDSAARLIQKDLTKAIKVLLGKTGKTDIDREMLVATAARDTAPSYVAEHFLKAMPQWLAHPFWNYDIHNAIANFSSRLSARKKSKINAWVRTPPRPSLEGSRAISVSTAYWYSNVVNTFFAAPRYIVNLARAISGNPEFVKELPNTPITLADGLSLSAAAVQNLRATSKEFVRNVDKMTQGLALTDYPLNAVRQIYGETQGIPALDLTPASKQERYTEYCAGARLGAITFTAEEMKTPAGPPSLAQTGAARDFIQKTVLPADDRDYLDRLASVSFAFHDRLIAETINTMEARQETTPPAEAMKLLRLLDNAMNRVRGPRLDVNDIAESAIIRAAAPSPSPVFMNCIVG